MKLFDKDYTFVDCKVNESNTRSASIYKANKNNFVVFYENCAIIDEAKRFRSEREAIASAEAYAS